MSLIFLFTRGSTYDEIGQGGLMSGSESAAGPPPPAPDSPAGRAEQELEIRQMLSARSERLVGRGEPALDIDAEVARLLGPAQPSAHMAGLTEEVRQLDRAQRKARPPGARAAGCQRGGRAHAGGARGVSIACLVEGFESV